MAVFLVNSSSREPRQFSPRVKSMVVDRAPRTQGFEQARVVQFNCSDLTVQERWQAVSVYKRKISEFYWFKFKFRGRLYQRPAKVRRSATQESIEAAFRTQLAKGRGSMKTEAQRLPCAESHSSSSTLYRPDTANKPETGKVLLKSAETPA